MTIKQKEILLSIINEIENKINLRGVKGYGVGHPYANRRKIGYGKIDINKEDNNTQSFNKKVKISRAFKKDKKAWHTSKNTPTSIILI